MAQNIQIFSIAAPGFFGLNTQDSPLDLASGFALNATNCVIDQYGRIGARKGYTKVNSSTGAAVGPPVVYTDWGGDQFFWADNLGYGLAAGFDQINVYQHGKMRVLRTGGTGNLVDDVIFNVSLLHVLSGSYFDNVFQGTNLVDVGGIHFDTASYNYIVGAAAPTAGLFHSFRVGYLTGEKPQLAGGEKSSIYPFLPHIYCADYFGEGPGIAYRESGWHSYVPSSAQLMYGTARAMVLEIASGATSGNDNYQWNPYRPVAEYHTAVTSGTPVGFSWPLITYNTSLFVGPPATIAVLGGLADKPTIDAGSRNIVTGSAGGWSGTSAGLGSPWTLVDTVTPQFSGTMVLRLGFGLGVNSSNTAVNSGIFIAATQPETT